MCRKPEPRGWQGEPCSVFMGRWEMSKSAWKCKYVAWQVGFLSISEVILEWLAKTGLMKYQRIWTQWFFCCYLMKDFVFNTDCHWSMISLKNVFDQKSEPNTSVVLVSLLLTPFYKPSTVLSLLSIWLFFHLPPLGDSAEPRKPGLPDRLQRFTAHRLLCQVSTALSSCCIVPTKE